MLAIFSGLSHNVDRKSLVVGVHELIGRQIPRHSQRNPIHGGAHGLAYRYGLHDMDVITALARKLKSSR